jgi:citrate lyase subunit beta/citryl-CoA lyase
MNRSYLFAPGHNAKLLGKVFEAGADAVILDLEDAVPDEHKAEARRLVAEALRSNPAWVRVNAPQTEACAADLDAVAELAVGIRVPKTESAEDVQWVADRTPDKPLLCAIETARGVLAAEEIARVTSVRLLALGGIDLRRDLSIGDEELETAYVRSHIVVVSRAAGLEPPVDSVYAQLANEEGLRREARFARRMGFFGKSAIHPRQISVLHEVFTPGEEELEWARRVISAFEASGGAATQLPDGEFVDLPVEQRARRLLELAAAKAQVNQSFPDE